MADISRAYEFLAGVRERKPIRREWWQDILLDVAPVAQATLKRKQKEKVDAQKQDQEFLFKALLDRDIRLREDVDIEALPPHLRGTVETLNKLFEKVERPVGVHHILDEYGRPVPTDIPTTDRIIRPVKPRRPLTAEIKRQENINRARGIILGGGERTARGDMLVFRNRAEALADVKRRGGVTEADVRDYLDLIPSDKELEQRRKQLEEERTGWHGLTRRTPEEINSILWEEMVVEINRRRGERSPARKTPETAPTTAW